LAGPGGVKPPEINAASSGNRPVVCDVRLENFAIADDDAEIVVVEPTGSETHVVAKMGGQDVVAIFRERHQFKPGERIQLKPNPKLMHLSDAETGKRLDSSDPITRSDGK